MTADPNHPDVTNPTPTSTPTDWFDLDDPFYGERDYPRFFCIGCGFVSSSMREGMAHSTSCPDPIYSPVACRRCAVQNWKRDVCRSCGKPVE